MFEDGLNKATFAAGKFWGVQFYFDQIPGVIESVVGYTGGHTDNPTEETVSQQTTGHAEAIEIKFDPSLINYDTLLKHFFRIHDPTQVGGQAKFIGDQYRSEIFYHTDDQKVLAEITMKSLSDKYEKPIITKLQPAGNFYPAEEKYQKYTQKTGRGAEHLPGDLI